LGWRGKSGRRALQLDIALKDWDVGSGGKLDADFVAVSGIVVVLGQTFTDFSGRNADYRICIGVIAGWAAEDFHADGALFDLVGVAVQGLLHYEAKENRVTFALKKERMNEEQLKLSENSGFIYLRLGHPRFEGSARCARSRSCCNSSLWNWFKGAFHSFDLLRDRIIRSDSADCPSRISENCKFL
jgi:hypothetical protein